MKCSFCGKEIENGADLCPHCGMILSLDDDGGSDVEIKIPEYTPNVFGAGMKKEEVSTAAMELPADDAEEKVEFVESIPEYVPDEYVFSSDVKNEAAASEQEAVYEAPDYDSYSQVKEATVEAEEVSAEEAVAEYIAEEAAQEAADTEEAEISEDTSEAAEAEDAQAELPSEEPSQEAEEAIAEVEEPEEAVGETEEAEEAVGETEEDEEAAEEAVEEEAAVESAEEAAAQDVSDIRVPDEDVVYPEYEAFANESESMEDVEDILAQQEDEEAVVVSVREAEEEYEEVDADTSDEDDIYVKPSKSKGSAATVIALCVLLVCLVFAGGYVIKNVLPEKSPSKPTTTQSTTEAEETSEDETTEDVETTEDADVTDDDETTEDIETTEDVETTEEETTEEETTTQKAEDTTKPVTTTRPVTTRPVTTRPATTRPATTKPATTTDPYGINDVKVNKPSSYLSANYKAYVTESSITVRASASSSAERVLYLEKGSEVIVYAKQNGFCYVYSTRFGVYGWANASYISSSRPVASTTKAHAGTVKPDANGSGKVMYTTDTLNMRKGPATSYGIVKTIPIGHPVKVIGYKSGASGWAYVTDSTTGINGWVSTAFLK